MKRGNLSIFIIIYSILIILTVSVLIQFSSDGRALDSIDRKLTTARSSPLQQLKLEEAWDISKGSRDVIVAVIDTGVDIDHQALKNNIWINPGESGLDRNGNDKSNNDIDDDNNGYVDDVHGWNFVDDTNNIEDNHGHGTHIAGIIGAYNSDNSKTVGISPQVSLMIIKYYDTEGGGESTVSNTIKAIRYATSMNAHIINYSSGGLKRNPREENAIRLAWEKGILFIAAAGNEKSNTDLHGYYPATYQLPNILSVTAVDNKGAILPSSNYGSHSVDIAAPGKDIYSTIPGGAYTYMTGTSQATAYVSGIASLMMGLNPDLRDPEKMIQILIGSGKKMQAATQKTKYKVYVDPFRALATHSQFVNISNSRKTQSVWSDTLSSINKPHSTQSLKIQKKKA